MKNKFITDYLSAEVIPDPDKVEFGRRVAKFRKARKMTQEYVATRIGVSPKHISAIECGRSGCSEATLWKLSVLFQCTIDSFFQDNDENQCMKLIPEYMLEIIRKNDEAELTRLSKYLDFYETMRK